jgi:hypothetical protein
MSGRSLENNSSGRNQNIHHDEISHQPCFKYEQERSLCQILGPKTMQLTNQWFNFDMFNLDDIEVVNISFIKKYQWPQLSFKGLWLWCLMPLSFEQRCSPDICDI